MERDKGIEPSPPPWQGGVLPLYESRELNCSATAFSFISRSAEWRQVPARPLFDTATLECVRPMDSRPANCVRPLCLNPLPKCGRCALPAISSVAKQNVPRVLDQYTRARIFHRRDSTPLLASCGAS